MGWSWGPIEEDPGSGGYGSVEEEDGEDEKARQGISPQNLRNSVVARFGHLEPDFGEDYFDESVYQVPQYVRNAYNF